MLVGVAPPPSLIPAHRNIGILHYKQAKLHKDMQHSVCILFIWLKVSIFFWLMPLQVDNCIS